MIDPIDGTRSFIMGQLHWATLIALNDGKPAARRRRATSPLSARRLSPSRAGRASGPAAASGGCCARGLPELAQAIVATTDPRHFRSPRQQAAYGAATEGARLVRYGGDCYCYTQLAMGLTDVVIETGLQAYDIQALIPLIEAAGGMVTDWTGGPCTEGGDVLACGDPVLHAALLARMAAALGR